jgi:hypothetical protein
MSSENTIEIEAPCCWSIRSCNSYELLIIGIRGNPRILRRIGAIRCNRGYKKKVKVYLSNDIVLTRHYVSNRGKHYIKILWKPETLDEEQAKLYTQQALGLYQVEEVMEE